jgi:two-component system, cell cycle sensor histidine kinase and response regulator CckA
MTSIMIVEDEFIVAQDLAVSLTDMGYEVCGSSESGESAMERAKKERPDLIIMDIVLKGTMDGIQTAQNMREQFDIPIIFLTAFADQALLERAKIAEPFGYLLKPFTNKELRSAIEIGLYRAEMEKKLRVSEKRFRDMANLLPSVICEVDAAWRVTFINKTGLKLFKLSKDDVAQGVYITEFFPAEEQTEMLKRFAQALSGQILDSTECQMTDKEGTILSLIVNSAPTREGDIITGVRISIVDITEIKRLQLRLRQAWKMEAIAALAGGIAHEYNNALANIVGYVQLMKLNQPKHVEVEQFADKIMASAQRMSSLTDQILAFARGGKYWPRSASLNEFVQNEFSLIRPSLQPEIEVITELQDDVILVEMDDSQFKFVLAALLANASEAMGNRGRIYIKTKNVTVDEKSSSEKAGLKPGLYACLQVEDNGSGMDEDTRQRIFEPFFSTKYSGRGLGMAAVYGIIKNHGGWIGVDSTLNSGTVVSIFIPGTDLSL